LGSKPYCPNCGWNARLAAGKLRTGKNVVSWILVGGVVASVVCLGLLGNRWMLSGFAIFAAVLIWVVLLFQTSQTAQLLDTAASRSATEPEQPLKKDGEISIVLPTAAEVDAHLQSLRLLLRPRPVRLSWRGWWSVLVDLAMLTLGFSLFWVYHADRSRGGRGGIWLLFAAILTVTSTLDLWSFWRDRRLMTTGEFAVGKIIRQEEGSSRWGSWNAVTYVFADQAQQSLVGNARDYSKSLFEEMLVTIFYDPDNPKRNMALEGSLFTIESSN
jgi:hypothetical protein